MSLIIIRKPKTQSGETAGDLEPGTWFLDLGGHVSVVLIDDRTHEKRVAMIGSPYRPFIADRPVRSFNVGEILPVGTILQICQSGIFEGQTDEG